MPFICRCQKIYITTRHLNLSYISILKKSSNQRAVTCSKLTIKTPELLVSLLSTFNTFHS